MRRAPVLAGFALALAGAATARAQIVTTMVTRDGLELPCVTVGPLAPLAQEYCVRGVERQGGVRKDRLGWTGLAVGDDRRITAVAEGSAAARAGLRPGEELVAVDGRVVRPTPGEIARRRLFRARGAAIVLTLVRGGATLERPLKLAPASAPADTPRSSNPLVGVHPLMNSRGEFVPCMGAGPLGPVAIAGCTSKAQAKGYVKADALGESGITLDPARPDAAVVASVTSGSPAAKADVRIGDVLQAVDGARIDAAPANDAPALLFGERGASRRITAARDGRTVFADLALATPPR